VPLIDIGEFISAWRASFFGRSSAEPWDVTQRADALIREATAALGGGYRVDGEIALHESATVEAGAVVKGPAIIGPSCLVASTAYLRGGVFLDRECIVGPGCELKTTFMFAGAKVAHLSFIGDSLIGARVNIEAGAIIANYRNEMEDKRIRIRFGDRILDTGVDKFGGLIGDGTRIGANAVVAPGAILEPGFRLDRLGKVDQYPFVP
jgi:NDP-sugar pyrophosphorylase family protein